MSIEIELIQIANDVASRAKQRATHLQKEYLDAEKLALDKKAKFEFANSALKRAANFQVAIGADYQCPTCWIERGVKSPLRSIPSQSRDDIFRCQHGHDLIISD